MNNFDSVSCSIRAQIERLQKVLTQLEAFDGTKFDTAFSGETKEVPLFHYQSILVSLDQVTYSIADIKSEFIEIHSEGDDRETGNS
jgi:hypothetical protein